MSGLDFRDRPWLSARAYLFSFHPLESDASCSCLLFGLVMVSSYFREMQLREECGDSQCTFFPTFCPRPSPVTEEGAGVTRMDRGCWSNV